MWFTCPLINPITIEVLGTGNMIMNEAHEFLLSRAYILVIEESAINNNQKIADINNSYKKNTADLSPQGDLAP